MPGLEALNASVVLYDNRSDVVRGADSVVRVRVCASVAAGGCGDDASSLVPVPFRPISADTGRCDISGGAPLACAVGQDAVDVQFSVSGTAILPLVARVGCLPCPLNAARIVDPATRSWQCVACDPSQYVIDNNDPAYGCRNCPAGAVCDGSKMRPLVAGDWASTAK